MAHDKRGTTKSDSFVIAISTTASSATRTDGWAFGTMYIPSAMTGTVLTIQVSDDNVTFVPAYDAAGSALTVTVAVSRAYRIPDAAFPAKYLRFVSGTTETAGRTITTHFSS